MAPKEFEKAVGLSLIEYKGNLEDEETLEIGEPHGNAKQLERSHRATSKKVRKKQKRLAKDGKSAKSIHSKTYSSDHTLPAKGIKQAKNTIYAEKRKNRDFVWENVSDEWIGKHLQKIQKYQKSSIILGIS